MIRTAILIAMLIPLTASAQYATTDATFIWGPDDATYASIGGGIGAGFAHLTGGYAVKLTDRGESFYMAGLRIFVWKTGPFKAHIGPTYRLSSRTLESDWSLVTGLELGSDTALFGDVYLDPGGFGRTHVALGFRLPVGY
jgi:hypothetical protein